MNAIIIDPFGWITISRAAELKGFPRSTLVDFIEEKGIPTRKMKNYVCVDIDEAIEGNPLGLPIPAKKEEEPAPRGKRRTIYRPSLPDTL